MNLISSVTEDNENFDLKSSYLKANYNHRDARYNLYELETYCSFPFAQEIKKIGESVCCAIEARNLVPIGDKYQLADEARTLAQYIQASNAKQIPLGENENYYNEISVGEWSSFFIGKNKIVTAAHCVCCDHSDVLMSASKLDSLVIVFGFQMIDKMNCKKTFEKKDVYHIKRVIKHKWSRGKEYADWAVIELDRNVESRDPVKLKFSNDISGEVGMLGHPTGLPLKFAGGATIKETHPNYIATNLSAFTGNSGSLVIEIDSMEIIAFLIQGNRDYTLEKNYRNKGVKRFQAHFMSSQEVKKRGYEICQRISAIPYLKELMPPKKSSQYHQIIKSAQYAIPLILTTIVSVLIYKKTSKGNEEDTEEENKIEFFYGS